MGLRTAYCRTDNIWTPFKEIETMLSQPPKNKSVGQDYFPIDGRARFYNNTDSSYAILEELLVTFVLKPGSVHRVEEIAAYIGYGRTPVRDAIHRLAREGMLRIVPRVGVIVTEVESEEQLEILEVRREIERMVAVRAATMATDSERSAMAEIADEMTESIGGGITLFARADSRFMELMYRASRNRAAAEVLQLFYARTRRYWYVNHESSGSDLGIRLHIAIAKAIARSDPVEAGAAADALMDYIEDYTRALIGKVGKMP